jgi:hypothetical protein
MPGNSIRGVFDCCLAVEKFGYSAGLALQKYKPELKHINVEIGCNYWAAGNYLSDLLSASPMLFTDNMVRQIAVAAGKVTHHCRKPMSFLAKKLPQEAFSEAVPPNPKNEIDASSKMTLPNPKAQTIMADRKALGRACRHKIRDSE